MLARLPNIDWKAVIAALGLGVALLGWLTNRRENKKTSARQDAAEERERERARRAVAEQVWITLEGPHAVSVDRLNFQVLIYNRSRHPIYACTLEKFSALSDAIQLIDEVDPLSGVRNPVGREINSSDLTARIVPPMLISEGKADVIIEFGLQGTFEPERVGLNSSQAKGMHHAYVELSFSDGLHRWLIDSRGTPPRLLTRGQ